MSAKTIAKAPVSPTASAAATPKIRVRLHSFDHKLLDKVAKDVIQLVLRSGGRVAGPIPLKTNKKVIVILRSTFKHKDARDKLESRVHKRLLDIFDYNSQVVNGLSTMSLPAGVDVDIQMI